MRAHAPAPPTAHVQNKPWFQHFHAAMMNQASSKNDIGTVDRASGAASASLELELRSRKRVRTSAERLRNKRLRRALRFLGKSAVEIDSIYRRARDFRRCRAVSARAPPHRPPQRRRTAPVCPRHPRLPGRRDALAAGRDEARQGVLRVERLDKEGSQESVRAGRRHGPH